MTAFTALIRKDLQLFFRDKRTMVMSFAAPIVLASFFGFVLGGQGKGKISKIPVALVNEDSGSLAQAIQKKLAAEPSLELKPMTRTAAETAVRGGKLTAAVILPSGFGDRAAKSLFRSDLEKPKLEVLYDPSRGAERQMIEGILTGRLMESVSQETFSGDSAPTRLQETLNDLDRPGAPQGKLGKDLRATLTSLIEVSKNRESSQGSAVGGMSMPFQIDSKPLVAEGGPEYNGVGHSFAGMGVQFVLFFGIEAGVALLLQRQRGLWRRFCAAPISRATLLGARVASAVLCTLLILAVMFTFARVVFGAQISSLPGFFLVCLGIAMMTAGFGLLIASLGKTPEGTRPIAILATLVLVMLGGSWMPVFLFPQWLQTATLIMPTRWAVDGLDAMTWRGLGVGDALIPFAVLTGYALVFAVLAWKQFRVEAE